MAERKTKTSEKSELAVIARVLRRGWALFLRTRSLSVTYAMLFSVIGIVIMVGIIKAHVTPLIFPVVGGFMFLGPVLLAGFFSLADRVSAGTQPRFADVLAGYSRTTPGMLAMASLCALLFVVWMTNAATFYSLVVGRMPISLLGMFDPPDGVLAFLLWTSAIGSVTAFAIFAVSAFSVPLMYYRRADLVRAVQISVATVFDHLRLCLAWSLVLAVGIVGGIVIFPLFLLSFPVLAFASHALYRELFPD